MVFNALATINVFKTTDVSNGIYTTFSNIYNLGKNTSAFQSENLSGWQGSGDGGPGCAISSDGKYILFAAKYSFWNYYISYSSDYGSTWSTYSIGTTAQSVCMSTDASYQFAISNASSTIFRNKNSAGWTSASTTSGSSYRSINCSSDGKYVVVTGNGVYYSQSYGDSGTFSTIVSGTNITNLSVVYSATIVDNSNGNTLYISVLLSTSIVAIYKVTNATTTPTVNLLASYSTSVVTALNNIVCSSDGIYVLCGASNSSTQKQFFLYSKNSGSSFYNSSTNMGVVFYSTAQVARTRVAISSSGQYMLAVTNYVATDVNIFNYSINYGVTWNQVTKDSTNFTGGNPTTNADWVGIVLNSSGTKAFMITYEKGTATPVNYTYKAFLATSTVT